MREAGHLYRGLKPVNWCLDCGSALAEAEVEYEDKSSDAIDVGFPVADTDKLREIFGVGIKHPAYAVIWTTTPWTLPANQAVCAHPDFIYDLVETEKGLLILTRDLVEACAGALRPARQGDRLDHRHQAGRPEAQPSVPGSPGADDRRQPRHAGSRHRPGAHRAGARRGRLLRRQPLRPADRQSGRRRRQVHRLDTALRRHERLGSQPQGHRDAGDEGRAAAARQDPAQLPALLAPQDADHLPRDHAVVRAHGRRAAKSAFATRRCRRSRTRSSSRAGARRG